MTHQVTKDLLWKTGRVPRACSWRWWGTEASRLVMVSGMSGNVLDEEGRAERREWFWPARVGRWWELGATTAHSSPLLSAWSLRCLRGPHVFLTQGFASAVPSARATVYPPWGRMLWSHHWLAIEGLGPRQGQSWEDPVHVWQRQRAPNNWKRTHWTLATGQQPSAAWGLLPVSLQISWGIKTASLYPAGSEYSKWKQTNHKTKLTMAKTEHWEDNNCKEKQILTKLKLKSVTGKMNLVRVQNTVKLTMADTIASSNGIWV